MNTQFRPPDMPMTTQAAEGLMRRRWSVAEVEAMADAGFFEEKERFELIGGEIVPMSPKGNRHELLKSALNSYWVRRMPDEFRLVPETTFRIAADTFLEPDFIFYRVSSGLVNLRPDNALLVVEIADSSLAYDLGAKAGLHAGFGICELWVINAVTLETHIHRQPEAAGFASITTVKPESGMQPGFAPELAVRLGELTLA